VDAKKIGDGAEMIHISSFCLSYFAYRQIMERKTNMAFREKIHAK